MGLIAALPEIDKQPGSVFVMHEKSEKLIPLHSHKKGQLSYVEGGIANIIIHSRNYVVPARHFFWVPKGIPHVLRVSSKATVLRSLYFYSFDDESHAFYSRLGIYPASELLIQMINYTERWDGHHINKRQENFEFLVAIKKILPKQYTYALPIVLPMTEDERLHPIIKYLERHYGEPISLKTVSDRFAVSERSLSRMFQSRLQISFLQYLKTLRMIKAIEMLLKTNKSIHEIALNVGYSTIGSFSKTFLMFTRSRPSDFRKL
ncbi:MAG: helix-turn-helix domain-containing protein [Flavisolibacter sp.]